jgi:Uri superfamily endonuclease
MQPIKYKYEKNHTLYAIRALMTEDHREITIGKLGTFSFRKGLYVYVGSAKRNLPSRIERHIQREKKQRWHFDYLRPFLQIVEIETFLGNEGECGLFQRIMRENHGSIPVRGFGSSDCRCPAHLFFVPLQE